MAGLSAAYIDPQHFHLCMECLEEIECGLECDTEEIDLIITGESGTKLISNLFQNCKDHEP